MIKKLLISALLLMLAGAVLAQTADFTDRDIRIAQRLELYTDYLRGVPGGDFANASFPGVYWTSMSSQHRVFPFYENEHLFQSLPPEEMDETLAVRLWGSTQARNVRWFNKDLKEVAKPDSYGRYTAYVEDNLPNGQKIRRFLPIYVYDSTESSWWAKLNLPWRNGGFTLADPRFSEIDEDTWYGNIERIEDAYAEGIWDWFYSKEGAELLGALSMKPESVKGPAQLNRISALNADYYLKLKLKVLGITPRLLKEPAALEKKAPVVHKGSLKEAGVRSEDVKKLREALKKWQKATENGFEVVMVRHGVIIMDEAFPGKKDETALGFKVKKDSPLDIASLTKLHSGLLMAQFLDQGLIKLDDPASKYLPDFPTDIPAITIRMLHNHTTGLQGHGDLNGLLNPFLETDEMIGKKFLSPGRVQIYNGMGPDLAGRIMEAVSGKSIFRLFHENFFMPLGNTEPYIEDMGYGLHCTAMNMARVGQLMLNKGSYGDKRFFSEETYNKLLPIPVNTFEPEAPVDNETFRRYGVGTMVGNYGLGEFVTHGSATGSQLIVDAERDMVFTMSRYTSAGYEHCAEVYGAITNMMKNVTD